MCHKAPLAIRGYLVSPNRSRPHNKTRPLVTAPNLALTSPQCCSRSPLPPGREGKRTDYTPHACPKLVSLQAGPGEAHGCPYKRLEPDTLRDMLAKLK